MKLTWPMNESGKRMAWIHWDIYTMWPNVCGYLTTIAKWGSSPNWCHTLWSTLLSTMPWCAVALRYPCNFQLRGWAYTCSSMKIWCDKHGMEETETNADPWPQSYWTALASTGMLTACLTFLSNISSSKICPWHRRVLTGTHQNLLESLL